MNTHQHQPSQNVHSYLGDFDDVQLEDLQLTDGDKYTALDLRLGTLFPGLDLPIRAVSNTDTAVLQWALSLEEPLRGALIVEPVPVYSKNRIGTLSVIHSVVRSHGDIIESAIVRGLRKVRIIRDVDMFINVNGNNVRANCVCAELLPQENVARLSKETTLGFSYLASWALNLLDPYALAEEAFSSASLILDEVMDYRLDPAQMSYWLAASLPIDIDERRDLLIEDNVAYRLRKELELLAKTSGIYCKNCSLKLTEVSKMIPVSEIGVSTAYVNVFGRVVDVTTFSKTLVPLLTPGFHSTEFTWFPGYAWIAAYCPDCHNHVGWKYRNADPRSVRKDFYGLYWGAVTHKKGE